MKENTHTHTHTHTTDGMIYHILGLEEPILWKWLYYAKQSTDSMQFYQINNGIFHRTRTTKNLKICIGTQKTPNNQSNLEGRKK